MAHCFSPHCIGGSLKHENGCSCYCAVCWPLDIKVTTTVREPPPHETEEQAQRLADYFNEPKAETRKPYTAPKLRKLDPRCVGLAKRSGVLDSDLDGSTLAFPHVTNCKCEKA